MPGVIFEVCRRWLDWFQETLGDAPPRHRVNENVWKHMCAAHKKKGNPASIE